MKFKLMAVIACTAALYSCDDSTSGVGDFVSNIDKIEAFSSSYEATSKTYRLDRYTPVQTELIWGNIQTLISESIQQVL